jgi:hypothetical protein
MRKSGKTSRGLPGPDFHLDLILPRTLYAPGERIEYEVRIENPHGLPIEFLSLTLYQNILRVVRKKGREGRSFKFSKERIVTRTSGPGFSDLTWEDFLQIPAGTPTATSVASTTAASWQNIEIAEVRYYIQVRRRKSHGFFVCW